MKKLQAQKGFTLVELAIVMTIIGLLIGGILKGQELMQNARTTATIAQVRAFEAAATTFRDSYAALPGDLPNASTRVPNCTQASCNPSAAAGGAGNGVVGGTWTWTTAPVTTALSNGNGIPHETVLFWVHMAQADLLSGISGTRALSGDPLTFGVTHPQSRMGGGFIVGNSSGAAQPGAPGTTVAPGGLVLALAPSPILGLGQAAAQQPLAPARAAQIDRKMDDGRPNTGSVQAYGLGTSCFAPDTSTAGAYIYSEGVTSSDCGLLIRIQG